MHRKNEIEKTYKIDELFINKSEVKKLEAAKSDIMIFLLKVHYLR